MSLVKANVLPVSQIEGSSFSRPRNHPFYLLFLAVSLIGYAFLGKGFAYVGLNLGFPLYIGELLLVLTWVVFLSSPRGWRGLVATPPQTLLVVFILWGITRTLPFVPIYGIDAIRDAALWYYGFFALLTVNIFRPEAMRRKFFRVYCKAVPWFVLWVPVAFFLYDRMRDTLPSVSAGEVPLLWFKAGDMAVHVGAVLAFVILFRALDSPIFLTGRKSFFVVPAASIGLIIVSMINRGGLVAASCGICAAALFRKRSWIIKLGFAVLVIILIGAALDLRIETQTRELSASQFLSNITSILFPAGSSDDFAESLQGTAAWRLLWWQAIIDETLFGPYFFTGRGFGENLAVAHNMVGTADDPLRSPHSSHMTILARMGVPGIVIWVAFSLSLCVALWKRAKSARQSRDFFVQSASLWCFCYVVMALVNSSFDVYLEGPQGAIWFWTVVGMGLSMTSDHAFKG
jgi:hypothetical protein